MTLIKALIILILVAVLSAAGFGAYYILFLRPQQADARDRLEFAQNKAQPTPDPSTPDFEKARELRVARNYPEARRALEEFLSRYSDSTHRTEAEALLGEINVNDLLSPAPGPGKQEYIVQRGDVLDRVAHKTKSSPELIFRANNLERIMLQIGQKLQVPQVDFAVEAHLGEKKLVLLNHGAFFKSYAILEARPLPKKTKEIRTKVFERLAFQDNHRVSFGAKDYPDSLRSVSLVAQPGYTIAGRSEDPMAKAPTAGLILSATDAEEVHTLVSPGTPVLLTGD